MKEQEFLDLAEDCKNRIEEKNKELSKHKRHILSLYKCLIMFKKAFEKLEFISYLSTKAPPFVNPIFLNEEIQKISQLALMDINMIEEPEFSSDDEVDDLSEQLINDLNI